MVKLNVLTILQKKGKTKYWLYNQLNNLHSELGSKAISYTNFQNILEKNQSIKYKDIDELCKVLDCKIQDLFIQTKD